MHALLAVFFLIAVARPGLGAGSLPDPNKLVEQYVKAAGGQQALARIESLKLEGILVNAPDGRTGTYLFEVKAPNRYYSELVVGGNSVIESYNGKSAWRQTASAAPATISGREVTELDAAAQYYNTRLLDPKKNKLSLRFVGHAVVLGKDALQVEVSDRAGVKRQVYFDPQSHLIVKESGVAGVDELVYSGHHPVQGIQLPAHIELRRGGQQYTITVTRAALNEKISERVFDFPQSSQVKLPDLKALFQEIERNQKAIDKVKENYAGTRTEDETHLESDGKVKKHEVKEYTFFYFHGHEVSTLVKKDGRPLPEADQKKEADRARKRLEDIAREEAKKEKKKEKDEADVTIDMVMRACQFVNPRRERFRGQDVLVFDFEANPDYKPKKLGERVVQKLAGVLWVDESAHDVARMEAYFVGDMKLLGFVANVQKGSGFVFEQAFVNNEVWLPTYAEAHVGARLLLKGIRESSITRYSDYRKFNVESLSTIGKPK